LKKRSKKLLLTAGFGSGVAAIPRRKVFLLLFVYKKQAFLALGPKPDVILRVFGRSRILVGLFCCF
jgi:hypothetical protein